MFGDPLSRPTAILEALLLMALAAIIGWLIARLLLTARLTAAQKDLADRQADLDACRRAKTARPVINVVAPKPAVVAPIVESAPVAPVVVVEEPIAPVIVAEVVAPTPVPMPGIEWLAPVAAVGAVAVAAAPNRKSEADALARIAARAGELNFDRIGVAAASEADDLKEIVGVGPFLERKLHSLGIYTFRQVGNFHREDIDKVNDIIEFFPGRIDRDNWVDQSKELHQKKYGTKA